MVKFRKTKMPELIQKKRLTKTLLATLLLVGVFFSGMGEARAEKKGEGASCNDNGDCESNYCIKKDGKNVCASSFEVSLQTPFAKSPGSEECNKSEKDHYETDANGNLWVCRAESTEWVQIVHGEDGGEILENYAGLLYKWLAGFIGIVAVLVLIVGGIQIITAGANQEGLQSGKDRIIAALVGLALLFLSSLILYTINPTFFT